VREPSRPVAQPRERRAHRAGDRIRPEAGHRFCVCVACADDAALAQSLRQAVDQQRIAAGGAVAGTGERGPTPVPSCIRPPRRPSPRTTVARARSTSQAAPRAAQRRSTPRPAAERPPTAPGGRRCGSRGTRRSGPTRCRPSADRPRRAAAAAEPPVPPRASTARAGPRRTCRRRSAARRRRAPRSAPPALRPRPGCGREPRQTCRAASAPRAAGQPPRRARAPTPTRELSRLRRCAPAPQRGPTSAGWSSRCPPAPRPLPVVPNPQPPCRARSPSRRDRALARGAGRSCPRPTL
jgi:hypothetical protein